MTEQSAETEPVEVQIPRKIWYAMVATFLSALLLSVTAIVLSGYTQGRLEQRIDEQQLMQDVQWCKLIVPIDDRNKVQAPRTDDDKIVAGVVKGLRVAYRCDEPSRRSGLLPTPAPSSSPTPSSTRRTG